MSVKPRGTTVKTDRALQIRPPFSSGRRSRTGHSVGDHSLLQGILDEFSSGIDAQVLYDRVLVEGDRSRRELEYIGSLLHRSSFGDKLRHLALTQTQRSAAVTGFGLRDKKGIQTTGKKRG